MIKKTTKNMEESMEMYVSRKKITFNVGFTVHGSVISRAPGADAHANVHFA